MMKTIREFIGVFSSLAAGVGALVGVFTGISTWEDTPKSGLVAEIRPMSFVVPFSDPEKDLIEKRLPARLQSNVSEILHARGFVKITMKNSGDTILKDINVRVEGASPLYYTDVPARFPENSAVIKQMIQGASVDVLVWTRDDIAPTIDDNYEDRFKVSYATGRAKKKIYMEGGPLARWIDRHMLQAFGVAVIILLIVSIAVLLLNRLYSKLFNIQAVPKSK